MFDREMHAIEMCNMLSQVEYSMQYSLLLQAYLCIVGAELS